MAKNLVELASAAITVALVSTVIKSRQSADVLRATGDAFATSLRYAIEPPPEPPTESEMNARAIADMEHELMIAGHESDCAICIESNRRKTLRERWIGGRKR